MNTNNSGNYEKLSQDLDEALQILADPDQYHRDIINIAFSTGFNEIKDFNIEFRKATGMCPIEYRAFHTQFKIVTGVTPQEYREKHTNDKASS